MTRGIVFLFISASIFANCQSRSQSKLVQLEWLIGKWSRENVKPGRTAYETWAKISPNELSGIGVSLRGTDTVFVEKLKIVVEDHASYYVADVPENPQPVKFKITELHPAGFTCENPDHDFPKKIQYSFKEGKLTARTSGDGKTIEFIFRKED